MTFDGFDTLGVVASAKGRDDVLTKGERLVVLLELMRRPRGVTAIEARKVLRVSQHRVWNDVRSLRRLVGVEVDFVNGTPRYTAVHNSSFGQCTPMAGQHGVRD